MKKLGLFTIILLVSLSVSFAQTVKKPLYERLGGQPAIEAVVKDFLGRVLNDERINKKFAKSDISRLQKNLTDYVCSATGGPCKYTGGDMKTVHQNLGITQAEFNVLIMNLVETMDSLKITAAEKNELLGLFGATAKDVATVKTNATGTELPANFEPLPPLNNSGGQTPTTAEGWFSLGIQQYNAKNLEAAINSFSECIKVNPKANGCYNNRGAIRGKQNKFDLAAQDYEKAIEIAPSTNSASYINLSVVYVVNLKKFDSAVSTIDKGLTYFPNENLLYDNRAIANLYLKKYSDAIVDTTKSIRLKKTANPYEFRAMAYCFLGEFDLAQYDEKKTKDYGGTVASPCDEVDSMLAAGKTISVADAGNRQAAELHILNGLGSKVNGEPDEAIRSFSEAIKTYPKSYEALYQRASTYFHNKNDAKSAKADVEQALKLNPNHEEAAELKKAIDAKLGVVATTSNLPAITNSPPQTPPKVVPPMNSASEIEKEQAEARKRKAAIEEEKIREEATRRQREAEAEKTRKELERDEADLAAMNEKIAKGSTDSYHYFYRTELNIKKLRDSSSMGSATKQTVADQIIADCAKFFSLAPSKTYTTLVHYWQGLAYLEKTDRAKAKAAFQAAVKNDPESFFGKEAQSQLDRLP